MENGPGNILAHIRRHHQLTRGDVQAATGLSRVTVSQRVDALLQAGLIVEHGTTRRTGGRRSRNLAFNVGHARVLAASVETTHVRVAVSDLAGHLLDDGRRDVTVTQPPAATLDVIASMADELLAVAGLDITEVCGMGISIPGPVDPVSGRPSQPPMLPGWDAYPIGDHLRALVPVPVLVSNDADADALGEQASSFPDANSLGLVKVSTGIGVGIVLDGRIYHGVDGGAGDIAHVRVADARAQELMCQCGSHGCLATIASGRAVARELRKSGIAAESGRDVERLLKLGDPTAAALTREAGRLIGEVLSTVVCLLNPGVLLIGGAMASGPLITGVRESLYRLSLPRATRHLTMQLGTLGDGAALRGLVQQVVDAQFAPDRINDRLV